MGGCCAEEPHRIGGFHCDLEDAGLANHENVSHLISGRSREMTYAADFSRVKTPARLDTWRTEVALHGTVDAAHEVEFQYIAYSRGHGVGREGQSARAGGDDDGFCNHSGC